VQRSRIPMPCPREIFQRDLLLLATAISRQANPACRLGVVAAVVPSLKVEVSIRKTR
jgi:hypothetical protein